MSGFFLLSYHYFKSRKLFLTALVIGTVIVSIYFGFKVKLQEDISKMMPRDSKVDKLNLVFQNSKFSDKIVINISLADSNAAADPNLLSRYSDDYVAALDGISKDLVREVTHKISDDLISQVYNSFYDNIPLFLSEADYSRIDRMITKEGIDSSLAKNYKTLISPASFVLKQFIVRDPVGITALGLKKLQSLQLEENYEITDGYIFTKDKKHLLFFITPQWPASETAHNSKLIKSMDHIADSLNVVYKLSVHAEYFGAAAVAVGNSERIKKDIVLTVSIAISILVLFISLFFKRVTVVVIIFLPVLIGGAMALALMYFFKPELSAIALGMGSVLLGITIDYSLHIFTHYRSTGSVKEVIRDLSTPLMLSCLITASSFLCLLFVKSEALQELGLFAALSVVCAALTALIVLPHFLKADQKNVALDKGGTNLTFVDRYTSYRFDKNRYLVLGIVFISVVCVFTSDKVRFESDMMKMNYISDELYQSQQNLNKVSSLPLNSIYVVSTGKTLEEALIHNEKIIGTIEALKEQGVVKKYSSPGTLLLSDSLQKIKIARWNNYWTTDKKQALEQLLAVEGKMFKFREGAFQQFFDMINKDYHPAHIGDFEKLRSLFLDDYISEKPGLATVVNLLKVNDADKDKVYSLFTENENTVMIDKKYITSKFVELMNADFNLLEVMSLGMVFIVLVISYGRIELGIIAFIPMSLSWLWTLGIMGILGIKFNIINIIISTFILGLGIDYSIFIMSGLLQEYKLGIQHLASYKTSIFLSAFTTIVGIGAMIFAQHPALNSIAFLSIIGMFSIIIISYTVEPLMFRLLITNRTNRGFEPFTFSSLLLTVFAYSYFLLGCLIMVAVGSIFFKLLPGKAIKRQMVFHTMLMYFCRSIIYIMANVKKEISGFTQSKFAKPAVIIANHQSFLDILLVLMLHPRMVMVTNSWVWNSPVFGSIVKMAGFFSTSEGSEEGLIKLEKKVKENYSIMVFPEGTRSATGEVGRFHKGAFLMAERLQLDVLPIVFHGTGDTIPKGDYLLSNGAITVKILDRIPASDTSFGSDYSTRTKLIGRHFRAKYNELKKEKEVPAYFRSRLVKNYIYKGPVLEWYMKVKLHLEKNYAQFHRLLPVKGRITDIGCGYGFLCYMMNFIEPDRKMLGIDYDSEKIGVAANGYSRNENIQFLEGDITTMTFPESDVFILNDVLHYLPREAQEMVLKNCAEKLLPKGFILLRDGDSGAGQKHQGTRLTEFFSTKMFRFNKTKNELFFMSSKEIIDISESLHMKAEVVDNSKFTSNIVYIIKPAAPSAVAID